MQVMILTRDSEGFYELMGPVFGSRAIERATHDRFYDDAGKRWYCMPGAGAASVKAGSIRNFWAASPDAAAQLIEAMLGDCARLRGAVPRAYAEDFRRAGFGVSARSVNFMEVEYPCQST